MSDGAWTLHAAPWRWVAVTVVWLIGALLIARHIRRAPDRLTSRLETLRAIVLVMLGVTLLQPERVRKLVREGPSVVAVVRDRTRSMTTRDVPTRSGVCSRDEWVESQRAAGAWAGLTSIYEVVERPFGKLDGADPEEGTDLNAVLNAVLDTTPNLRAVLLLSDGDWNMGESPVLAATRMRAQGVPLFTVCVGRDRPAPDVVLENVATPSYVLAEERVGVPVELRNRMDRVVQTEVRLEQSGTVVARLPVTIPPHSVVRERLVWQPVEPGTVQLSVVVPPVEGEERVDNNRREFRVSVRREVLQVLLMETLPRWEYRYLRNALVRDPGVEVHCWVHHPGLGPGAGKDYLRAIPSTRAELGRYDVMFLGDVGLGEGGLTLEQAELIRGVVEQLGSGLVWLPGRAHRQLSLLESPLGELMPVVMDERARRAPTPDEGRFVLTHEGREHGLTRLVPGIEENEALWRQLPGFFWCAPVVRAKPGSVVLAVHNSIRNDHGRLPLLVIRPAGHGLVLFLGTDGIWRWRLGVEDTYHYRFWGQVVRWMAHRRHMAHVEGFRGFVHPERPWQADRVRVLATVVAPDGSPVPRGEVKGCVVGPSGTTEEFGLTLTEPEWGLWEGAWVPSAAGVHVVKLRHDETGREVELAVEVQARERERVGEPARPEVLRELAEVSAGAWAPMEDLGALVERIRTLPAPEPMEIRWRLWCDPRWGALVTGLLMVYWCGRKWAGRL